MNFEGAIEVLLQVDSMLLKAAGAGTDALFMNLELKLHQELGRTFQSRARRAMALLDEDDGPSLVVATLRAPFTGWDNDVQDVVTAVTRQAYIEGKRAILLRAHGLLDEIRATSGVFPRLVTKAPREISIEPSFELVDQKAVDQLVKHQLHWIGENYDNNLAEEIDDVVRRTMVESGLGRAEAAKLLREALMQRFALSRGDLPLAWQSRMESYFELISANAVGNARVRGSLQAMQDIKITRYVIVCAMDERSCGRCKSMDGKTFEVRRAKELIDAVMAAKTPDDVKAAHPWAKNQAEMEASPDKFPLPPYHGICRCTVDISADSELSFEP